MLLSLCGGWVGWGLQSHFRVQPNHCVEVVLHCVVVAVVTIYYLYLPPEGREPCNSDTLPNNFKPRITQIIY